MPKEQGSKAFIDGKKLTSNPFYVNKDWGKHTEWRIGWKNKERQERNKRAISSKTIKEVFP